VIYAFIVERTDTDSFGILSGGSELPPEVASVVGEELEPVAGQADQWATVDCHTIVTRYEPKPVGTFPEDRAGVGVPVAGVAG